ncbi:MAG: T9SS type A sorting domain-containing protein [Candidatus Krumholzibacteria bacterium]
MNARLLAPLALMHALLVTAPSPVLSQDQNWDNRFDATLGLNLPVHAIAIDGADVYVGGSFTTAGGMTVNRIARWDGFAWQTLGPGLAGDVNAIAASGGTVYVGGAFTTISGGGAAFRVARWNGSSWSALGSGVSDVVNAIAIDGGDVYVGGAFTVAGGAGALRIARWNGSTWSPLGSGVTDVVNAIAIDGGDVYVGGAFTVAGGAGALHIARWNGSTWSPLGSGVSGGDVNAIAIDGGDVYVGGAFTLAGGAGALRIARWNGSSWSPLGGGVAGGNVNAIAVGGGNVFAGGTFTTAGGAGAFRIAQWNGGAWMNLASGVSSEVRAVGVIGLNVFVGGSFTIAGLKTSLRFARWNETITPVFILGFDAKEHASGLELSWRIFADEAISGFRIYRGENTTGPLDLVNTRSLIPREERSFLDTTVSPGTTYRYTLAVVKPDGSEISSGEITATASIPLLVLEQSFPNPFNPSTTIRFVLDRDTEVRLRIFDVRGGQVITLVDEPLTHGPHEYLWDGRNAAGARVGSGVYFYELRAGKRTFTRKMVLTK